jgi:hypothetical protein
MLIKKNWSIKYIIGRIILFFYEFFFSNYPWITFRAVKILKKNMKKKKSSFVEFGCGRSTVFFSKLCQFVLSIEHDIKWYQKVRNEINKKKLTNVKLKLCENRDDYINALDNYKNNSIDFILIDGKSRGKIANKVLQKIKIGGFLILDDAQRYIDNNNENEWFQFKEKVKNWEYIPTDNWVSRTDLWKKII